VIFFEDDFFKVDSSGGFSESTLFFLSNFLEAFLISSFSFLSSELEKSLSFFSSELVSSLSLGLELFLGVSFSQTEGLRFGVCAESSEELAWTGI